MDSKIELLGEFYGVSFIEDFKLKFNFKVGDKCVRITIGFKEPSTMILLQMFFSMSEQASGGLNATINSGVFPIKVDKPLSEIKIFGGSGDKGSLTYYVYKVEHMEYVCEDACFPYRCHGKH